jgi:hypothetical protein
MRWRLGWRGIRRGKLEHWRTACTRKQRSTARTVSIDLSPRTDGRARLRAARCGTLSGRGVYVLAAASSGLKRNALPAKAGLPMSRGTTIPMSGKRKAKNKWSTAQVAPDPFIARTVAGKPVPAADGRSCRTTVVRGKRMRAAATLLLAMALSTSAMACDPLPGWRPPSPEAAFAAAKVVIHARVLSQRGLDPSVVDVEVLRTLKGHFAGRTVNTASHSLCGVGTLQVGEEYVFFLPSSQRLFVSHLTQPAGLTAKQVLQALPPR